MLKRLWLTRQILGRDSHPSLYWLGPLALIVLLISLWPVCEICVEGTSLSVFRRSGQEHVPETPELAPPQEVPQVELGILNLDALRASGVSITGVSPAAVPAVPEDNLEEQTDSTWGGAGNR